MLPVLVCDAAVGAVKAARAKPRSNRLPTCSNDGLRFMKRLR